MPSFLQPRTKQYVLPSTASNKPEDQAILTIRVDATAQDLMVSDETEGGNIRKTVVLLATLIEKWNYTEPDGTPVPVTTDNVARLSPTDIQYLEKQLEADLKSSTGLDDEEKKA
ncbi:hypothetical protein SAMN04487914_10881 [Arthrobacter sp. ok909]|uniref:hypothetical protein n=1 Tax=Arthrobacter sp. ok909 TaxID=1761746 RepID=UPI000882E055|nr:hypothetical protein [Arthrobacter sp. ok909]SDP33077.1 hypothetical protein SAMN04487914_10881 [Arthrobacter sp. ok909]